LFEIRGENNLAGINSFEKSELAPATIKQIQGALCVQPDGNLTSLRDAMVAFFRSSGGQDEHVRAESIQSRGMVQADMDLLSEIQLRNPDCKLKLKGPTEVGRLFFAK
jgi:hypothetical protein